MLQVRLALLEFTERMVYQEIKAVQAVKAFPDLLASRDQGYKYNNIFIGSIHQFFSTNRGPAGLNGSPGEPGVKGMPVSVANYIALASGASVFQSLL